MPAVILDGGEVELLGDLRSTHATLHVLLVGKHEEVGSFQLLTTGTGGGRGERERTMTVVG